jgi:glycosyltransferase involved in cell wall biosynthesis
VSKHSYIDMRVVHISDRDDGGAAVACRRLIFSLHEEHGSEVVWIVGQGSGVGGAVSVTQWPSLCDTFLYKITTRLSRNERVLRYMAERNGCRAVQRTVRRYPSDVFHLHGLHEGISFDLLANLGSQSPVVWTLHDMWPLTGYCYYSYQCEKYLQGCQGGCPQLGCCGAAIRAPAVEWLRRNRSYQKLRKRLVFVAPSRWMAECAQRRFGDQLPVRHIANGVDLNSFRPSGDKAACRRVLGLPQERPIVLTGAVTLDDPRKGANVLPGVCEELGKVTGVRPLLVGLGGRKSVPQSSDYFPAGTVVDERLMNLFYNAADVFVLPSRADNLPNMLVEAVSAGTPVVASDVGGCRDVVRDGETGFLAKENDSLALGNAIWRILSATSEQRAAWSGFCRAQAEREYDIRQQAARYLSLYEEMTNT